MRSASDDSGSVTAELMLLMPTLVIGVGILGAMLSVSFERISLERDTAAALREVAIGRELAVPDGVTAKRWTEGRLICLQLAKEDWLPISAKHCALPLA
jgi:hypothetical protein